MTLQLGDKNETVRQWRIVMSKRFSGYAKTCGALPTDTDTFGARAVLWQKEYERRTGQPPDGKVSDSDLHTLRLVSPTQPTERRKIWFYSAPGSGSEWWAGPSFEVGEWCKNVLHLQHQPIGFPIGGYLGLMGGDPGLSYNEVIAAEGAELERLLDTNPDINDPDLELWFSAYSQSADGLEDALVRLFGDGGKYAHLRSRINGVIQFGNPSKRTTGIARKARPEWLYALVHNLNHPNDFYAEAPDAIRPVFYAEIVQADTSLPFFAHVLKVALPIIGGLPFFGPLLAPMLAPFTPLMGLVSGPDEPVDAQLVALLSAQGVLTHIPDLIQLVSALPGIQAHGDWGPFELAARDVVASFRR